MAGVAGRRPAYDPSMTRMARPDGFAAPEGRREAVGVLAVMKDEFRSLSGCAHWQPAFQGVLRAVEGSGPQHDQLVDVRDALRGVVGPSRPLVVLCPHADDGAISAACLMHEFAVGRGMPVIE